MDSDLHVNQQENNLSRFLTDKTTYDPLDYEDERHLKRQAKQQRRLLRKQKKSGHKEFRENGRSDLSLNPRTENQRTFLKHLNDYGTHMLFGIGPAGTGKTYISTKWAAIALLNGQFDRIILCRPAVSVSEKLGFLPGDIGEKMAPWLLPITDVLSETIGKQRLESYMRMEKIEIAPLAFMRGRTFKNAVVMLDETQNCTSDQLKMFLTRIGEGSKLIITGDTRQSDFHERNGLTDFIGRFCATEGIEIVKFDNSDITRHHLIGDILKMYGE